MFNMNRTGRLIRRTALTSLLLTCLAGASIAQQPAAAVPARQLGTVKSIDGSTIKLVTSAGAEVTVTVDPAAAVLQLPPGSTDLKTATPSAFSSIAVGDRVVTGKPGDTAVASRVILMKSSAIAALNAEQQADWQRRGTAGLVKGVSGPEITISAGNKTETVETTPKTVFRRYADDSVDFKSAKPGSLADLHPGDQLSVRGDKSADGLSIQADEVVTGTFSNLSGLVSAVDPTAGTVTLKDLTTKKIVIVKVTANSDVRKLPAQAAAMFAARNNPAGAPGSPAGSAPGAAPRAPGGGYSGAGPGAGGGAGPRSAGMDLSRMLARLPTETLADLHNGDAVMIVASQGHGSEPFTAITLLAGVEQLLSAAPGAQPITLSPWNISAPEGGGGPQ